MQFTNENPQFHFSSSSSSPTKGGGGGGEKRQGQGFKKGLDKTKLREKRFEEGELRRKLRRDRLSSAKRSKFGFFFLFLFFLLLLLLLLLFDIVDIYIYFFFFVVILLFCDFILLFCYFIVLFKNVIRSLVFSLLTISTHRRRQYPR